MSPSSSPFVSFAVSAGLSPEEFSWGVSVPGSIPSLGF